MKSLKPFIIVGLIITAIGAVPIFEELFFLFIVLYGPAIVFAAALGVVLRNVLNRSKFSIMALGSLVAYFAGVFIHSRGAAYVYLAPSTSALVFLSFCWSIGEFRRLQQNIYLLVLGSALAAISGIPLWIMDKRFAGIGFPFVSHYFWWGLHILLWYVAVAPCAVRLAAGRSLEKDAEKCPAGF